MPREPPVISATRPDNERETGMADSVRLRARSCKRPRLIACAVERNLLQPGTRLSDLVAQILFLREHGRRVRYDFRELRRSRRNRLLQSRQAGWVSDRAHVQRNNLCQRG